jgi:hypothetical protein
MQPARAAGKMKSSLRALAVESLQRKEERAPYLFLSSNGGIFLRDIFCGDDHAQARISKPDLLRKVVYSF